MKSSAKSIVVTNALTSLAFIIAGCSKDTGKPWTPSEHPDPQAILDEAKDDASAKRYENALAKHVWFHENALTIRPSLYGVRLSFALGYWVELGKSYPPALEKLKSLRDKDDSRIREGELSEDLFHDLAAISECLGEDAKTTELFVWLDRNEPDFAKSVYSVAEPSLIRAKEFEFCGKYLDPRASFKRMLELYNLHKNIGEASSSNSKRLEFGRKRFANDAATLVALLAVNGRKDEAGQIAAAAEAELDDQEFRALLAKANAGEVPEPRP